MLKSSPATVRVPCRIVDPAFAATEYVTVPSPVPLPPEVILMKLGSLLAEDQLHIASLATLTLPVPPLAAKDWWVCDNERHGRTACQKPPSTVIPLLLEVAAMLWPALPVARTLPLTLVPPPPGTTLGFIVKLPPDCECARRELIEMSSAMLSPLNVNSSRCFSLAFILVDATSQSKGLANFAALEFKVKDLAGGIGVDFEMHLHD